MKLSANFYLQEFISSDTATRNNIDNTPSPSIIGNLTILAQGLEHIREVLDNKTIHINSGYRCQELNTIIKGSKTSAHMQGYAADFICPSFGRPIDIVKKIVSSGIKFDQVIQEGTWVHISFDPKMRQEVLTANFNKTGTTYIKGIQETTYGT